MNNKLGSLIKELRKNKGFSQSELARLTSVSQQHIHRIEVGDIDRPSFNILQSLSAALDIDVKTLAEAADLIYTTYEETPETLLTKLQLLMPQVRKIPIVAEVHAPQSEILDYAYWAKEKAAEKNIVGLKVRGYCLEPVINEGDTIFIDRDAIPDIGKIILCYHNGHNVLKLIRYMSPVDLEDCNTFGVVLEVNRKL